MTEVWGHYFHNGDSLRWQALVNIESAKETSNSDITPKTETKRFMSEHSETVAQALTSNQIIVPSRKHL